MASVVATLFVLAGPAEAGVKKTRRTIVRRVTSQIGAPYRYGAESPKRGFDCSGLTWWTYNGHGADLPRTSLAQFQLPNISGAQRIKRRSALAKGDLVFFKTTSAVVGHVGIYVGNGDFVSATSSGGVRKASVHDPYYWGKKWVGATRVLH
jgi:cell wall-associated NlpC family hydrolase